MLSDRAVLRLSGPTAAHFLQGLCSNDFSAYDPNLRPPIQRRIIKLGEAHVEDPAKRVRPAAVFAGLFSPKGRVLFDALIAPAKPLSEWPADLPVDSFLIDCDAAAAAKLLVHLKRYNLRSQLALEDVSALYRVWSLLGTQQPSLPAGCVSFADPRLPALGRRVIAPFPHAFEQSDPLEIFNMLRILHGIPQGVSELIPEQSFPLESGLDLLHGVSFDKGCYVGQELTARVHHTGIIRKRCFPALLADSSQPHGLERLTAEIQAAALTPGIPSALSEILSDDHFLPFNSTQSAAIVSGTSGAAAGTVLNRVNKVALVMLRTDKFLAGGPFCLEGEEKGTHLIPLLPSHLSIAMAHDRELAAAQRDSP
ncbi:MAG: hypothetical protein Q8P67_23945 [archaeon]|nr:hypothetical protein [archaeon]